jgi:hypothetical protein
MKTAITFAILVSMLLSPMQLMSQETLPQATIKEVMERIITPATNTLWGADNPQTDEEWQTLDDAAITMIAIGNVLDMGGSGPSDNDWAADPVWKAFNQAMSNAAVQYRQAIQDKSMDAMFEAGDAIYTPCEACHLQFNPGVAGQ